MQAQFQMLIETTGTEVEVSQLNTGSNIEVVKL